MFESAITTIPVLDAHPPVTGFQPMVRPRHIEKPGDEDARCLNDDQQTGEAEVDLFAQGLAEGQKLAQTVFEIERGQLRALIASAQAMQAEPSEELAVLIAETVERLVVDIVGDHVLTNDQLLDRARRASSMIAECDAARTLWVHPDDLAALEPCGLNLHLAADRDAPRGSMRIDCSHGWIEHGTSLFLRELRVQLGLWDDER
jgi:flagellar assembly protein FliH